jgi:hypothetical protein
MVFVPITGVDREYGIAFCEPLDACGEGCFAGYIFDLVALILGQDPCGFARVLECEAGVITAPDRAVPNEPFARVMIVPEDCFVLGGEFLGA